MLVRMARFALPPLARPRAAAVAEGPVDLVELSGGAAPVDAPTIGGVALPRWAQKPLAFGWDCPADEFSRRCREAVAGLTSGQPLERLKLGENFTNSVYLVHLDNGLAAIWKPESGEYARPLRVNISPQQEARREVMGYLLDAALGHLARVPPLVRRQLDGSWGTLQLFVPGTGPGQPFEGTPRYGDVAVYDHVVGNLDRHDHNWLQDEAGNIIPIDHGLILPESNSAQGAHNFLLSEPIELEPRHRQALERLQQSWPQLQASASQLGLPQETLMAMRDRVKLMRLTGRTSNGWRGGDDFPTCYQAGLAF
ncbi:MAG: hypothetical protein AB7S38_24760 [Vulcanimicrobiota bacterium]